MNKQKASDKVNEIHVATCYESVVAISVGMPTLVINIEDGKWRARIATMYSEVVIDE